MIQINSATDSTRRRYLEDDPFINQTFGNVKGSEDINTVLPLPLPQNPGDGHIKKDIEMETFNNGNNTEILTNKNTLTYIIVGVVFFMLILNRG